MKVLTNLLKFILIVVLAVCSIAIGIIQIVTKTVLNKNYINYKTLYQQIFQEFSNQQKISMYNLIQKLEQMILTIGKTLLSFEENYVQDKNIKLYIEKLKKLKEKYVTLLQ